MEKVQKKISIVTPVYNCAQYIEKCILSIQHQDYDNYEHIIVDGGSTDATLDIIRSYVGKYPMKYISESDQGMYDAIRKGFAIAQGEIFAWLNADDTLFPWAFSVMNHVIDDKVQWCTAINTLQDEQGVMFRVYKPMVYRQKYIQQGLYDGRTLGFIQQESTFWSRSLWEKSIFSIEKYKLAGDFLLWKAFAKYEPLYTVMTITGGFRVTTGQLSSNADAYYSEAGVPRITGVRKKLRNGYYFFASNIYRMLMKHKLCINLSQGISAKKMGHVVINEITEDDVR